MAEPFPQGTPQAACSVSANRIACSNGIMITYRVCRSPITMSLGNCRRGNGVVPSH